MTRSIIVGSRASALALAQTNMVIAALQGLYPDRTFEIKHISTHGDRVLDRSLTEIGGKGVFVKEIEEALLGMEIDLAVHSFKDLPTEQPDGLNVGAILERADPRDVLISRKGASLEKLQAGATVGTSSRRRAVQLLRLRPDIATADIRGNVDTRLRKLDEGQYDAIVLAAAGLGRLGLTDRVTEFFDPQIFLPAPGQGALALELRASDSEVGDLIAELDHAPTRVAVLAERAFLKSLGGGCDLPIGAYGWLDRDALMLKGVYVDDSGRMTYGDARGDFATPGAVGHNLAEKMLGIMR